MKHTCGNHKIDCPYREGVFCKRTKNITCKEFLISRGLLKEKKEKVGGMGA